MQARPATRFGVDEDDGGWYSAVVVADELPRELALSDLRRLYEPDAHQDAPTRLIATIVLCRPGVARELTALAAGRS